MSALRHVSSSEKGSLSCSLGGPCGDQLREGQADMGRIRRVQVAKDREREIVESQAGISRGSTHPASTLPS